jgi:hypothetical protein
MALLWCCCYCNGAAALLLWHCYNDGTIALTTRNVATMALQLVMLQRCGTAAQNVATLQLTSWERCKFALLQQCSVIASGAMLLYNNGGHRCLNFCFSFTQQLQDLPWRPPPPISVWEKERERERKKEKEGGRRFETCFIGWQNYNNASSLQ